MIRSSTSLACLVALLALLVSSATAQLRTYTVHGVMTSAAPGTEPELWDTVQVGDPFTLTYLVDTDTSTSFDDGTLAIYTEPILEVDMDIGGVLATLKSLSATNVQVTDDRPVGGGCIDAFEMFVLANSFEINDLSLVLREVAASPACPATTNSGVDYPTAVDVSGFTTDADICFTTTSFGFFAGIVTDVTVPSSSPFADVCSGDGGDQAGCTDCPCGNDSAQGTVGGCLNSAGTSTRLLPSGTVSIAAADLRFDASGAPANSSAVLTSGDSLAPANMASPCFGLNSGITATQLDGLRCVVQGVLRHGVRPSDMNGDIGSTTNGWGTPNGFFNFAAFTSGVTKHFQVIYRDDVAAVCMRGQNTTQAVSVSFIP